MIKGEIMKTKHFIKRIFFPKKCSICSEIVPLAENYCSCCGEGETLIGRDFCPDCGYDTERCLCSKADTRKFSHIAAVYIYSGTIRQKICAFKFENEKQLASFFAEKMSERIAVVFPEADFDFITFVPSTDTVLKQRGYNQSELLAMEIAKKFFIPCKNVLYKIKDTPSQHTLNAKERASNITGSIECTEDLSGKTVLLCDDVKTTGATLSACVEALKQRNAKEVYCICIALSDYSEDIF